MSGKTGTTWKGDAEFRGDVRMTGTSRQWVQAPQVFDHFTSGATTAFSADVPIIWVATPNGAGTTFVRTAAGAGGTANAVTNAGNGSAMELAAAAIIWTPSTMATSTGNLVFEARAKFVGTTTASDGDFWLGLSSLTTSSAAGRMFTISAASAISSNSTGDGVFWGYSSLPSSGVLFNSAGNDFLGMFSNKANTGAVTATAIAKDSAFHIYRIEVDVNGDAAYFFDGAFKGSVPAALTAATALTPYVGAVTQGAHTHTVTVDYVYVGGGLV